MLRAALIHAEVAAAVLPLLNWSWDYDRGLAGDEAALGLFAQYRNKLA